MTAQGHSFNHSILLGTGNAAVEKTDEEFERNAYINTVTTACFEL